jgi:ubiquinone/menaquinone biosynthesis C-methylase UbiE
MSRERQWDHIYRTKSITEVSWYQSEARLSVELIRRVGSAPDQPIVDVGGGASTLVDGLLGAGYRDVTVVDLASTALVRARERLRRRAAEVKWIVADVLDLPLATGSCAIWHDRAVFHFLTDPRDRARYVAEARRVVRRGGHVIVASFGPDAPARCSGLDVVRYSAESLHAEFGPGFRLLESRRENHRTPTGSTQAFVYCLCRAEAG